MAASARTERPILFSGAMVRAILEGRKSQTRRLVNPQPNSGPDGEMVDLGGLFGLSDGCLSGEWFCPYGEPGDRLWVRENGWQRPERTPKMMRDGADTWEPYYYDADGEQGHDLKAWGFKRRPSIFMPRWACRLVLEVTAVRVERLQAISGKDIIAEGAVLRVHHDQFGHNPISAFDGKVYLDLKSLWAAGWDLINAKRAPWSSNPWVWVVEFRRVLKLTQEAT